MAAGSWQLLARLTRVGVSLHSVAVTDALAPLRVPRYRALWVASVFSNLGSFFQAVAASWLMKELTDSSATWIGLMVASNMLPLLFLALISGVVADTFDRAKVMLASQIAMGAGAAAMAVLTALDVITPGVLLTLGLVMGVGMAFNLPAWQSLVPDLVPRGMLASAVALNSAGFNVARAVGPAIGGLILATAGPALGFGLNAVSYLGVIVVAGVLAQRLVTPEREQTSMTAAISQSIRFARFTPAFRRLLALVALFALTSASLQSVLPNRTTELGGSETMYGLLLGAMGLGALIAAFIRRWVSERLGARSVPATITIFGLAGIGVGTAPNALLAGAGMVVAGACWVLTLTTLNASSQMMAPEWIRGRAMSLYTLAFSGVYPIGAIMAGGLADLTDAGSSIVMLCAATAALGVLAPRFRLPALGEIVVPEFTEDRTISSHVDTEGGPVMVLNTWTVAREDLEEFFEVMAEIRLVRLRTGAYRWRLYRNVDNPHRISEMFLCESWEQHLAQHRRIDDASAALIRKARSFDQTSEPMSRHLVAIDVDHPEDWEPLMIAHEEYHRTDGSVPLERS
jgi:MFS family permease